MDITVFAHVYIYLWFSHDFPSICVYLTGFGGILSCVVRTKIVRLVRTESKDVKNLEITIYHYWFA